MDFSHVSVLLKETIDGLNIKENGIYLDGTLGGGGHSQEILKKLGEDGKLIGLDKDIEAIEHTREKLSKYGDKLIIVNEDYEFFDRVLDDLGIELVDGILLDIGVSSYQFDQGERGFSYNYDAPLDMRMDRNSNLTAKKIVNEYSEDELTRIFYEYGEEKWAKRIAEFIVYERNNKEIETTFELTEIIKKAIPAAARRDGGHPSRQVFQALRIETNDELGKLKRSINRMVKRLNKGGRIAIISFHSLEDRIAKEEFKELSLDCVCPPEIPKCMCDKRREVKIITRKPIVASDMELEENHRARSAKLRIAERL
ncbi:MAG: 16S rRNA (cytosine(1402)-N(4))-methyltransferase RsmH [Tissierellia bacterium]|nr:16S rRNA (cytosine(1402)-N(4))-methyltransferase RsmH [Tissierellia bacterium]